MSMVFLASCSLPPSSFHVSFARSFRALELQIFCTPESWKVSCLHEDSVSAILRDLKKELEQTQRIFSGRFNGATTVQGFLLVAPGVCHP